MLRIWEYGDIRRGEENSGVDNAEALKNKRGCWNGCIVMLMMMWVGGWKVNEVAYGGVGGLTTVEVGVGGDGGDEEEEGQDVAGIAGEQHDGREERGGVRGGVRGGR